MKHRGFTFIELIIAASLTIMVLGLLSSGIFWLRHGVRVITSLDEDIVVLILSRTLYQDLNQASSFVYPPFRESDTEKPPASQLVFTDISGDLHAVFVDKNQRLIQYSYSRKQFRDLAANITGFKVIRRQEGMMELRFTRKISQGTEEFHGNFEIPSTIR